MDNQHRMISGYTELTPDDIDLMNRVKRLGQLVGEMVQVLEDHPGTDKRWIAIGVTQLQQGGMALTRSIAKPDFFF